MMKQLLAALLVLGSASAQAQPIESPVPIRPNEDSPEELRTLRDLSACMAERRTEWARRVLSYPYLSDAQARDAGRVLKGTDNCITRDGTEVVFRTSGLIGNLAAHFLRSDMQGVDSKRLMAALSTLTALNASEDFALCVAVRDPAAARDLALSEPGSATETQAAEKLAYHVRPCVSRGEQLSVDLQSLRALMSTALYRGVRTALGAKS